MARLSEKVCPPAQPVVVPTPTGLYRRLGKRAFDITFVCLIALPLICAITMLAFIVALVAEPILWQSIIAAAPEILYTGIFASGIAFTLQVIGQRYTSAPQAAIFLSSEAPFAALFAFLWLGERMGLIGLGGCLMIFVAMMLCELVPQWRLSRKTSRKTSTA